MKIVLKFLKNFWEKNPPNIWGVRIVKKNFWENLVGIMECIIFVKNK